MISDRTRLAVIFATIIIDVLGIGLMLPVLPILIEELTGGDIAVGVRRSTAG